MSPKEEENKSVVQSRAAEREADPSMGLTWTNWTHGWLRAGASPLDRRSSRRFLIIDIKD